VPKKHDIRIKPVESRKNQTNRDIDNTKNEKAPELKVIKDAKG